MNDSGSLGVAVPSESERWNSWRAKGRADDVRFRRRLRMAVIDIGAAAAFGGVIWFAFQF